MAAQTIETLYLEYSTALDWALSLTGRVGEENRFAKYRTIIKKQLDIHRSGVEIKDIDRAEMKEYAEAYLEACALVEIHKKFSSNTNKYFIEKLSIVFGGELYASEEPVGTDSYARNTQAELIMASKCVDPSKLSFWGNDIVYNFESFKFGIEVKRINSDLVTKTFEAACVQVQTKRNDVGYGLVVLCIDRFLFLSKRNGIFFPKPTLVREKVGCLRFEICKNWLQKTNNNFNYFIRNTKARFEKSLKNILKWLVIVFMFIIL